MLEELKSVRSEIDTDVTCLQLQTNKNTEKFRFLFWEHIHSPVYGNDGYYNVYKRMERYTTTITPLKEIMFFDLSARSTRNSKLFISRGCRGG